MKYNYEWTLKDAKFAKNKGKVFSCFACGGGSTMGYKLAGFDVIGCNEIDPKMMECYIANHNPKYHYCEPIQDFKNRDDLPEELFNLDILDGSPPCSSFSMAGNREKDWGKDKKFREGQQKQVLDTLFFDFIDLAKRLQPKIVIAENVKGLLMGEARQYLTKIITEFEKAGYKVTYKLLNAAKMGVPQRRERVFFFAIRNDLADIVGSEDMFLIEPYLEMKFNETEIPFGDVYLESVDDRPLNTTTELYLCWKNRKSGDTRIADAAIRFRGIEKFFNAKLLTNNATPPTFTTHKDGYILYDEYRKPNKYESCCIGTFPQDYNFCKSKYHYIIGMSVPPVMMANIADEVYEQWLSKIKEA